MKETLNQALKEILDAIIVTKDFVIEQAPDVVQQLLAWRFTISLVGFVVLLLIFVVIWVISFFIRKNVDDGDEIFVIAIAGFASAIPLVLLPLVCDWLKILIAPKLFIIEYIMGMIK